MKTRTVIERVGENLGPIDWSYNFLSHYDTLCGSLEQKHRACERDMERLKKIEEAIAAGKEVKATTYGGWPRCGYGPVIDVGMYDGWPYWRPVPSVCIQNWMGSGEWATFANVTNIILDGAEQ